jgi:predicted dinucleotide-binding enzyme
MKVAIVGTGSMGTGLGRQFTAGGHEVIVGSRDPQRARAKAEEIGAADRGTYEAAVAQADVLLLAVNWWDIESVHPQLGKVDGKILIDCTNPYTDNTEVVARLARDAGYDPWDAGPLGRAYNVEKVAAVMVTIAYVVGTGTDKPSSSSAGRSDAPRAVVFDVRERFSTWHPFDGG